MPELASGLIEAHRRIGDPEDIMNSPQAGGEAAVEGIEPASARRTTPRVQKRTRARRRHRPQKRIKAVLRQGGAPGGRSAIRRTSAAPS